MKMQVELMLWISIGRVFQIVGMATAKLQEPEHEGQAVKSENGM